LIVNWLVLDNPVALWWIFLAVISVLNVSFWLWLGVYLRKRRPGETLTSIMWKLAGAYTLVCAFRALLPRADVQRIVLWDTWFSSVLVGRTVATLAELAFVAQWAIMLYFVSQQVNRPAVRLVSLAIVPLIFIAEIFSWYAVVTTNYLGNTVEESLWAFTYVLIGISLLILQASLVGSLKWAARAAIIGCILYVSFMLGVDVPMYFNRWQSDLAAGKDFLGLFQGFRDLNSRWVLTRAIDDWRDEIAWKTLYFSFAVWVSLALCFVPLTRERWKVTNSQQKDRSS
jgi:hypothetical protein